MTQVFGDRILVVDDDPDIVRFVETNLAVEGFEVITASDGELALSLAEEGLPELVLLDVMMPKVDGFEVCRRLRSNPRTSNISIILLTARSMSSDKIGGLAAGADDYILKPFDPLELVARVKATLRRAREMRDVNPLTGLSGNVAIQREIQRRIDDGLEFALMYIDLDNFKALNDHYGFLRGDEAIKSVALAVREAASTSEAEGVFVGHIGGDDFAVVCEPDSVEDLAQGILDQFEALSETFYDLDDLRRGFIRVVDRRNEEQDYPLMTMSIGVATTAHRLITSHVEASEIAAEMKQYAKRNPLNSFAVDRRSGAEES